MNNCKNCFHYYYHNPYTDFGFCKRYNLNVSSKYLCESFLQYAADFVKQYSEKSMNKFQKNLDAIKDKKRNAETVLPSPYNYCVCGNCSHYYEETEDSVFGWCNLQNTLTLEDSSCDQFVKANNDKTMDDPIRPNHYKQGKLTCAEVCEAMCANKVGIEAGYVFNVTKYMYRYNMKDGIKDVRKAREYCDFLIAHLEEKENELPNV